MDGLLCSNHAHPRTKFPTVPPAVELRLGKISRSLAQDLVCLPQFPVLPLERLQPVPHLARHTVLKPRVALVLTQPLPQGFPAAADLGGDRADRRPLRGVLALMLEHHPDGSLLHLRRVALHCLLGFHGSILSGVGASGKPGAVHLVHRKSGAKVPVSTIHAILRNPLYIGWFEWNGKTYQGKHEPLVSVELWEQVQGVLDGRSAKK